MGSPISRGHGPDCFHLTTQQMHDHLERLRDQMVHLAAKAADGYEGSLAAQDLRDRIGQVEHVLVDRLIRSEQLALARLREETRRPLVHAHPERMFETMPDDIVRHHVLPFLEAEDLVNLAQASEMGMSSMADLEIEQILRELWVLSGQHPVLASIFMTTLSSEDSVPAGQKMHRLILELAKFKQAVIGRTDIKPWVDLYFSLKKSPQTRLRQLLTRETIKAIAYDFSFGRNKQESRRLFQGTHEIVLEAVSQCGSALEHSIPAFRADRKIVLAAVRHDGSALRLVDPEFRQEKKIVLEAVSQYGLALRFAAPALRRDHEVVLAALIQDWRALGAAEPECRKNKQIVLTAVRRVGRSLFYADAELKRDKEIVLAAVSEDGTALEFADLELRKDREVVLVAVRNHGRVLFWADPELRKDKQIVLIAVLQDRRAFQFADPELQRDHEIMAAADLLNREATCS